MKRIPQGRYSKEFREEVVKHVTEQGLLESYETV
jgi:transposase-like protein